MVQALHEAVKVAVPVLAVGIGKKVIIDLFGGYITAWLRRTFVKTRRHAVLWHHGFTHTSKTPGHSTRSPLKCDDGPCPILRKPQVQAQPEK